MSWFLITYIKNDLYETMHTQGPHDIMKNQYLEKLVLFKKNNLFKRK